METANNILYSIIIPHFNVPTLLERCLSSLPRDLSFQIIVVDDNSDSNIVDFNNFPGLNRSNVECFFLKEKHGAGFARNVGIKHARGKWLLFADADDFFHKDFCDIIYSYKDSDYEVVYFDSYSVYSDTLAKTDKREDIFEYYLKTNDINVLRFMSHPVWGKMYLRSFIIKNKIICDDTPASNDVLFSGLSGLFAERVKVDTKIIYCCTVRSGSICTRINASNVEARIFVANKYNKILSENHIDCKYWMNLIGPIIQLIRIEPQKGYFFLFDYIRDTKVIRMYYDFTQSGFRFIKRILRINHDENIRNLQRNI